MLKPCRERQNSEIITAIAYDYFASGASRCGHYGSWYGRTFDSTNVCQPILTGITTIGLDHVAFRG